MVGFEIRNYKCIDLYRLAARSSRVDRSPRSDKHPDRLKNYTAVFIPLQNSRDFQPTNLDHKVLVSHPYRISTLSLGTDKAKRSALHVVWPFSTYWGHHNGDTQSKKWILPRCTDGIPRQSSGCCWRRIVWYLRECPTVTSQLCVTSTMWQRALCLSVGSWCLR